jgi:protein involved in polysaccharide export with SLBB domain
MASPILSPQLTSFGAAALLLFASLGSPTASPAQDAPPLRAVEADPADLPALPAPRVSTGEVRENLVLKPGDIVSVNVFAEPSLSGAFVVGPGGEIVFPLLGGVRAAGKSAESLGIDIKALLEADYIRSAQVAVAVAEEAKLAPHTVTVIGQVMRPGQVAFEQDATMDLFTAISTAGGLTERANRSRVELKRREGDDLRTQLLDLETHRVLKLRDKDTVIVHAMPEKEIVEKIIQTITVIGEVRSPGQIPLKDDQPIDIISAIAMAGGFTPTARPTKVYVRRPSEAGVQTHEVNVSKMQKDNTQPFMLQPNDTVTVPQSVF